MDTGIAVKTWYGKELFCVQTPSSLEDVLNTQLPHTLFLDLV